MKQLAEGLYQLRGFPPNAINVYLMGDVLVDAGTRHCGPPDPAPAERATGSARTRSPTRTRITRARARRSARSSASRCGAASATSTRWRPATSAQADHWINRLLDAHLGRAAPQGRPARCARATRWRASRCSTFPGHSAGHVAYWRESDRVLVLGDVLNNMNVLTGIAGPARAAADLHRRPGAQPRVGAQARGRSSRRSPASGTGRRCATRASSASSPRELPVTAPGRVGFIGLGIMGSRMAANLRRAGFELVVWNRTARDRARPGPAEHGARGRLARRPRSASACDRVITMVVDGDQVERGAARATAALAERRRRSRSASTCRRSARPPRGGSAPRCKSAASPSSTRP